MKIIKLDLFQLWSVQYPYSSGIDDFVYGESFDIHAQINGSWICYSWHALSINGSWLSILDILRESTDFDHVVILFMLLPTSVGIKDQLHLAIHEAWWKKLCHVEITFSSLLISKWIWFGIGLPWSPDFRWRDWIFEYGRW